MPVDTPAPASPEDADVAPRRCGRCAEEFPGDPELHPTALPAWWVCPACREALFGASS